MSCPGLLAGAGGLRGRCSARNSRGRRMREPCIAKGSPVTPQSEARELILIWTARNSLKSPESDEEIQENPSSFSWSSLGLDLVRLGGIWPEPFRETASAGRSRRAPFHPNGQSPAREDQASAALVDSTPVTSGPTPSAGATPRSAVAWELTELQKKVPKLLKNKRQSPKLQLPSGSQGRVVIPPRTDEGSPHAP